MKPLSLDPDRWGTIASTVCAIHCALTGIAVSVVSMVGFIRIPVLEYAFLFLALLFGSWAVARGFAIHRSWIPFSIFGVGFVVLIGSHLVDPTHNPGVSKGLAELFSVIGGACLVSFHYINKRFIKSAKV